MKIWLLLSLMMTTPLLAEPHWALPWGPDADLAKVAELPVPKLKNPASLAGLALIRFHQTVISPVDGPRSHYVPSSSCYARDAIRLNGFLKGFLMACNRLMRENKDPWIYPTETIDGRSLKVDRAEDSNFYPNLGQGLAKQHRYDERTDCRPCILQSTDSLE